MPKLFLVSITLLAASNIIGQTNVAIAPNKMNVLYIGMDNPISVAAYGTTDEKVAVSIDGGGGSVSKVSAGNYVVRVNQITDNCTIQVADMNGKLVGASKFRVRNLPRPLATIGGFASGENVSANAFRQQAGLGLFIKDFPFDLRYEVISYTITMEDDNGGVKRVDCEGALFSEAAKESMKQFVVPGRTITIDNIRAKTPGGNEIKVAALVYYIK